jgi:hypothetical protein
MPVDGKLMDALPKLEIISNFGVGVDAINLDDAAKRKIIVTNTPDVLNECVADTALALVMNTVRKFPQSERYLRAGNWAARGPYPLTTSLGGKTLGILGLGRIGEAIAKRAATCGMKIRYHNRTVSTCPTRMTSTMTSRGTLTPNGDAGQREPSDHQQKPRCLPARPSTSPARRWTSSASHPQRARSRRARAADEPRAAEPLPDNAVLFPRRKRHGGDPQGHGRPADREPAAPFRRQARTDAGGLESFFSRRME